MRLTIFTPTYNRKYVLQLLYDSLCSQTCMDFEWLVVDDGSVDGTEDLFADWQSNVDFPVRYYKTVNGGKHRAINKAVELAHGEWFFIVDSDDYLFDGSVVEKIFRYIDEIEGEPDYCAVVGLRINKYGDVIGTPCQYQILDTDFLSYRVKLGIKGDRAEIIRTSIMREFPFPEFQGEKFISEAVVWNRMAQKYRARYVNEKMVVCEYLPDGLTRTKGLERANPCGTALLSKEAFLFCRDWRWRLFYIGKYWECYAKVANERPNCIRPTLILIICYPLSIIYRGYETCKRIGLLKKRA